MRDVSRLYVVEDPTHVQTFLARESGDPVIDHGDISVARIENPIGAQQ
jgi:hypothetical protein